MPGFDGTGPAGAGPFTGRSRGYCIARMPDQTALPTPPCPAAVAHELKGLHRKIRNLQGQLERIASALPHETKEPTPKGKT